MPLVRRQVAAIFTQTLDAASERAYCASVTPNTSADDENEPERFIMTTLTFTRRYAPHECCAARRQNICAPPCEMTRHAL